MAMAMAYPETQQGKKRTSEFNSEVSGRYVNHARYVLRNNFTPEGQQYPDRCLAVMAGTLALTEAYAMTQVDVKQREEEEDEQISSGSGPEERVLRRPRAGLHPTNRRCNAV